MCGRDGDRVVFSHRGQGLVGQGTAVFEAVRALPVTSATIDGECVVCNGRRATDFERLRSALARGGSREAFLFAFDLIELNGRDMRFPPWHARRTILGKLLSTGTGIRFSEHLDGTEGTTVFRHACAWA